MKRTRTLSAAAVALALAGAMAMPVQALGQYGTDTQVAGTAELHGTVKTLALPTLVIAVKSVSGDHLSSTLRLFKDHDLTLGTDTATLVRRDGKTATLASIRVTDTVNVRTKCTFTTANNVTTTSCLAQRIYAYTAKPPRAEKVFLVGNVTAVTTTSLTLTVMSVVHQENDALDVQALHDQTLTVAVAKGVSIRKGGHSATLASITSGSQLTVRAHCQLVAPFNCTADRITIKS